MSSEDRSNETGATGGTPASKIASLAPLIPGLLARLEELFGPRLPGWELPKMGIHPEGPFLDSTSVPGNLTIYFNTASELSFERAFYQLSHEIAHCLEPSASLLATMLEEGMCVWFSFYASPFPDLSYLEALQNYMETQEVAKNYRDALRLHHQLMALDARAIRLIRNDGRIDEVTPEKLMAVVPGMPRDLADRLCERREMR